jgi:hypothetical protein
MHQALKAQYNALHTQDAMREAEAQLQADLHQQQDEQAARSARSGRHPDERSRT